MSLSFQVCLRTIHEPPLSIQGNNQCVYLWSDTCYFMFCLSLIKTMSWNYLCFLFSANEKEEGKELTGGGGLSDKVSLYKGDITVLEVDAIVNAGKDLHFDLRERLDGVCCLKAAQLLNCPWLPSAVTIREVLVLGALHKCCVWSRQMLNRSASLIDLTSHRLKIQWPFRLCFDLLMLFTNPALSHALCCETHG